MAPTVFFIDDSEALRDLMQQLLGRMLHVECLCLANLSEVEKHAKEVHQCQLAIIDINLGMNQPNGIDVYHWLLKKKFEGKILFLTGHARSHPLVAKACSSGAMVLEKPVENTLLVDIIKDAIQEASSGND